MVFSEKNNRTFTPDSEPEEEMKKREEEDILEEEREEGTPTQECLKKSFGWGDKEFWEDCWENTEIWEKSTILCITSSTSELREISSKTKKSSSKPFSPKKTRMSDKRKSSKNRNWEDKTTWREEREKETKDLPNTEKSDFKLII